MASPGERRSSAARPRGSASAARRRSPARGRTSSCSRAAPTRSSARRRGSARSRWPATSRARPIWSGSSRAVERHGGVDVLVINGGGPPRARALDVSDEAVEDAVELLLLSAVRLVRLCRPHLERAAAGA